MQYSIDLTKGLPEDFEHQLNQLSNEEQPSLKIIGGEPYQDAILRIIQKHNLCYPIQLINLEHTPIQRTIDELIWENQHQMATQTVAQPLTNKSSIVDNKRTRPIPGSGQHVSAQIDVDFAFQTEVVEELDVEDKVEEETESRHIPHIDFKHFSNILRHQSHIATSTPERLQLWYRVLGMVAIYKKDNKTIDISEDESVLRDSSIDFAKIKSKAHPLIKGMSQEAAQAIAMNPSAFVDGIDYHHLPQGFHLVKMPDTEDAYTLDYHDAKVPNYDALSLTVYTRTKKLPISKNEAHKLLNTANETCRRLLGGAHQALMDNHYDRNDLQTFRQNLPILISLNPNALVSLFNLCHDRSKGHMDGKKLDYYLRNQPKILSMLSHAAEKTDLLDNFAHIKAFCQDKVFLEESIPGHLWVSNLSEPNQSFLIRLNDYYHFNWQQLNSLWHLQATHGQAALNQVLNTLEELKPDNDQTYQFFQHVNDLSQLLDKQTWKTAYKRITAMDKGQQAWWEALLNRHMAHTNEDDMLKLVKIFTQFSRQIHNLNLEFYTPVSFDHVRSMPLAVARMLAIIDNCQHENIEQQWACITDLPLQASGAIRAIEESDIKQPCSFVTPEMGLTAVNYDINANNNKGYQSIEQARNIFEYIKSEAGIAIEQPVEETKTEDLVDQDTQNESESGLGDLLSYPDNDVFKQTAIRGLFRYLAWTPHKAPLHFYKQAIKNIDDVFLGIEWDNLTQSIAYIMMAGATTGILNSSKARQMPEKSQEDLTRLMSYFKYLDNLPGWLNSLGAKKWIRVILMGIFALQTVSPDPNESLSMVNLFDQIFDGLTIDWQWVFNFKGKLNSIVQPLNNMQPLLIEGDHERHKAFMTSLRFLAHANIDQLTNHLNEIRALGEMLKGTTITSQEDLANESWDSAKKIGQILEDETIAPVYLKLIALKSQFNIDYDNMHLLEGLDLNNPTALYALELLSQMTHNKGLTIKQLVSFVRSLPEPLESKSSHFFNLNYFSAIRSEAPVHTINYKAVHQLLKSQFGEYFHETFFKNLSDVALDKETIELIKSVVPPSLARDTCFDFFKRFPKTEHSELVSDFLTLAKQMKEDSEEFVLALTDSRLFDIQDASQFRKIIQILNDNGEPKTWLFILRALKRSHQDHVDFSSYADNALSFWLKHLTPKLNRIQEEVNLLPPSVFDIMYSGFEAEFLYSTEPQLSDAALVWARFCYELAKKPIACETILKLTQAMIQSGSFNHSQLNNLAKLSLYIEDKTALSLATYFVNDRVDLLYELLNKLNASSITKTQIQLIVSILEKHANTGLQIDHESIDFLFNADHHPLLEQLYETPPYPSISQASAWISAETVAASYRQFCLAPCERNDHNNGFYHEDAYIKALEQVGLTPDLRIRPREIRMLQEEAILAKSLSIDELKKQLKQTATASTVDYAKLTAICAELLHRSMGREGNTFELNETQYLAVYKSLRDGSDEALTGKFDSGEGKTRVFMVIAGALQAQGKTVEFITRNMTLAKREYMNFQSYFDLLGAKTAIIHAQSKATEYQKGQIHFSDVSQFSLFINQQLSQNIDPRVAEKDRALLLDEADQTYFDAFQTRYNYATTTVNFNENMNWVYDMLIEFFQHNEHQNLYYNDIDRCNETFRDYVANYVSELQMQQLQAVSDEQIESWHDAAMSALQLTYEHDFNISLDEVISVPGKGRQLFSRAIVVKDNREQRESSFANGVQQCLHARLNWLKKHPDQSTLSQEVSKSKHPFVIRPESDIIYFNTSKGFLDDYQNSIRIALTGTTGSELELEEVKSLLGITFIDYPRHNALNREDLPLRLCKDESAHLEVIVDNIKQLQMANQPVLIICEDDKESALLAQKLQAFFQKDTITRIHSRCTSEEEQRHADMVAGKSGQITVSTDMYARGVDIKLHGKAQKPGLGVLLTYMPSSEREYIQSINRAGRYGSHGTSRMILNKQRLLTRLRSSSLSSSFFIHSGVPERKAMSQLNIPKQRKRLVTFSITDFQRQLEKLFFAYHFDKDQTNQSTQLKTWARFDKTIRQMWDKNNHELEKILSEKPVSQEKIGSVVNQYGESVKQLWQRTFPHIDINQCEPKVAAVFNKINTMQPQFTSKKPVFSKYDRSHDGFAVLYDHWFEETFAWWRGERCLFANTRAWLRGEGTIFANLQAWWRGEITLWEYLFPVSHEKTSEDTANTEVDHHITI